MSGATPDEVLASNVQGTGTGAIVQVKFGGGVPAVKLATIAGVLVVVVELELVDVVDELLVVVTEVVVGVDVVVVVGVDVVVVGDVVVVVGDVVVVGVEVVVVGLVVVVVGADVVVDATEVVAATVVVATVDVDEGVGFDGLPHVAASTPSATTTAGTIKARRVIETLPCAGGVLDCPVWTANYSGIAAPKQEPQL